MAPIAGSAWRGTGVDLAIPRRYHRSPDKLQHLPSMNFQSPNNGRARPPGAPMVGSASRPYQNSVSTGYWRSLKELSARETINKSNLGEFLPGQSEWRDELSRRDFLRLAGASIALASFSACTK